MVTSISQYKEQNKKIVEILADNPAGIFVSNETGGNSTISNLLLQMVCPDGRMSTETCKKILNYTEKERKLTEVCDLSKLKIRPDDGRIYLLIKRRGISSVNYIGLIDKLCEHFFGEQLITMEKYFEIWMEWRTENSGVTPKTLKENRYLWNRFLKGKEITIVPLRDLTVEQYIDYFRSITKGRLITKKLFNDIKSILNGMIYLAVEQKILDRNCLNDINYRQFKYKAENNDIRPYTEDERLRIIDHLAADDDFYSLAIKFDFYMILRIGELKGLKWSDIKGDAIYIQRFVNDQNQVIEDIKGHREEGRRYMPLTPSAKMILMKVHENNPDSEYIFIRNGQPLATVTFNRRLKKCCQELGIEYRSSHKIRFSTASIMYKNGAGMTEISSLLGHTTLQMTSHYLRNITAVGETAQKMEAILG